MPHFSPLIAVWYRQSMRSLPWRETSDPYKIWLSEIILQQTRVDQGLSYYEKFTREFPTVHALAAAAERDVLNLWQGLGYYSRARNLHASAKFIAHELNGKFPQTYNDILQLKGVGNYTAAAIASFAFNEAKAVVDGNVYRVLSRVFDLATPIDSTAGQKEFQALADSLLPTSNPGEHNQAIMELGALICTPKPNCEECPVAQLCLAKQNHTIEQRPVKSKKIAVRDRYFHYLIYNDGKNTLITERTSKDVWQHLYEFPLIESSTSETPNLPEIPVKSSAVRKHILSHQRIHARFYHFDALPKKTPEQTIRIPHISLQDYPLPRLIDRYLEEEGL